MKPAPEHQALDHRRARAVDELRQERSEEQRGLGIEQGHDKAVTEEAPALGGRRRRCLAGDRWCRTTQRLDAEVDEVLWLMYCLHRHLPNTSHC